LAELESKTTLTEEEQERKEYLEAEAQLLKDNIASLNEEKKMYDIQLQQLKEALELRKQFASVKVDESSVVGVTSGVGSGDIDDQGNTSFRLDEDYAHDSGGMVEAQYNAETSQMSAAATSLGGTMTDGGGIELETSIENYKKLYDVIGQ
jgi:hypothetical protein